MSTVQKLRDADTPARSQGRILDAAEIVFARLGFEGAGMKAISERAGVAQGLLHYHFGNKEGLYETVIARRAAAISGAREQQLSQIDLGAPNSLEAIFDALYRPTFEEEGGGQAYAIIFGGKYVGEKDAPYLVNKYYDQTAKKFIDAMLIAEPKASRSAAAWAYTLAIGALFTTIGQDGRQERLAGLPVRDRNGSIDDVVKPLVFSAVGGLQRLITEENKAENRQ